MSRSSGKANSRRTVKRFDLQLRKTAQEAVQPNFHSQHIHSWFANLSITNRLKVVEVWSPWLCDMITQMNNKIKNQDYGYFKLKTDIEDRDDLFDLGSVFKFRIASQTEITSIKSNVDNRFLKSLRLIDTEEYIDTLTIEPEIIEQPDRFFYLFEDVSQAAAFRNPCYVHWDLKSRQWIQENPPWLDISQAQSVAIWAATQIEKQVWMQYWQYIGEDPRAQGELQVFKWGTSQNSTYSRMKETLVQHWKAMDLVSRSKLTDEMYVIFDQCFYEKNQFERNGNKAPSMDINAMLRFIETKAEWRNTPQSLEQITGRSSLGKEEEFITYIFQSDFERIETVLDKTNRKLAEKLAQHYSDKLADDLLLNEDLGKKDVPQTPSKDQKQKKRKKRRRKTHSRAVSNSMSNLSPGQDSIEHDVQKQPERPMTLLNSAKDLVNDQSETGDFQIVWKKKPKKPAQSINNPASVTPKKPAPIPARLIKHNTREIPNSQTASYIQKILGEKKSNNIQILNEEQKSSRLQNLPEEAKVVKFNPDIQLHNELIAFHDDIQSEFTRRGPMIRKVVDALTKLVQISFPDCKLDMYGSQAAGLALVSSDLDLLISNTKIETPDVAIEQLRRLVEPKEWVRSFKGIETATVPIVKLCVETTSFDLRIQGTLKVDITFDYLDGLPNTGLNTLAITREITYRYPILPYLMLAIKSLLSKHNLNDPYTGGLSSYSLVVWIAAIIIRENANSELTLGQWFSKFLEKYGKDFNPKTTGIWCYNVQSFYELQWIEENVFTADPVDYHNNISRTSFEIAKIQELFANTYDKLMHVLSSEVETEILKKII